MDFKKGDKVRVTNLSNVMFGEEYFNEGDETTVKDVTTIFGIPAVLVSVTKNADSPLIASSGIDDKALGFSPEELGSLTKIEALPQEELETTLTKKLAVAKVDSEGTEIHEQQEFKKGDTFDILSEPRDLMTMIIFGQLEAHGDLDKATIVSFGEGFVVFFNEESEKAWNFNDYFEIKEVA